jgi:hypothetical protein
VRIYNNRIIIRKEKIQVLINKSMLAGALAVCRPDKEYPLLNCVCIEPDGTIVAMNKMLLYAAQPVTKDMAARVPLDHKEPLTERVILSADTATELHKAIPQDRLFKGLMEHASLSLGDTQTVHAEIKDGQVTRTLKLFKLRQNYVEWKPVFRNTFSQRMGVENFVYNRKRLVAAVQALEASCKYNGEFAPVFSQYSKTGRLLWRSINELTGQHVLMTFDTAEMLQEMPPLNTWEGQIMHTGMVLKKRCN